MNWFFSKMLIIFQSLILQWLVWESVPGGSISEWGGSRQWGGAAGVCAAAAAASGASQGSEGETACMSAQPAGAAELWGDAAEHLGMAQWCTGAPHFTQQHHRE